MGENVYAATIDDGLNAAAATWTCLCHPTKPCRDCRGYAAKAVAAFLRAFDPADRLSPHLMAEMAEEAVRHG